jgi:hypothetical protein
VLTFRHAAVCAFDLANTPSNADKMAMLIDVKLKPDHELYPAERKFTLYQAFTSTMDEFEEMLRAGGGEAIIAGSKQQHQHMKNKGGLGVANIMVKWGDITDVVRVVLPGAAQAKQMPKLNGDWGQDWVPKLRIALEMTEHEQPNP